MQDFLEATAFRIHSSCQYRKPNREPSSSQHLFRPPLTSFYEICFVFSYVLRSRSSVSPMNQLIEFTGQIGSSMSFQGIEDLKTYFFWYPDVSVANGIAMILKMEGADPMVKLDLIMNFNSVVVGGH